MRFSFTKFLKGIRIRKCPCRSRRKACGLEEGFGIKGLAPFSLKSDLNFGT